MPLYINNMDIISCDAAAAPFDLHSGAVGSLPQAGVGSYNRRPTRWFIEQTTDKLWGCLHVTYFAKCFDSPSDRLFGYEFFEMMWVSGLTSNFLSWRTIVQNKINQSLQ